MKNYRIRELYNKFYPQEQRMNINSLTGKPELLWVDLSIDGYSSLSGAQNFINELDTLREPPEKIHEYSPVKSGPQQLLD